MFATKEGSDPGVGVSARPNTRYSTNVRFVEGAIGDRSIPTSVDIFEVDGCWYCQVCRGGERTRPMGPYSKEQAGKGSRQTKTYSVEGRGRSTGV